MFSAPCAICLVAFAAGIGGWLWSRRSGRPFPSTVRLAGRVRATPAQGQLELRDGTGALHLIDLSAVPSRPAVGVGDRVTVEGFPAHVPVAEALYRCSACRPGLTAIRLVRGSWPWFRCLDLLLVLSLIGAALLGTGWACGRIQGARALFNRSIEDAALIESEVQEIGAANRKVAVALYRSQQRNQGRISYDVALIEELKAIVSSFHASQQQARLFRTSYAMMEDMTVSRLFHYYNNTLRLHQHLEALVQAERSKDLIVRSEESFSRYGIVLAKDAGKYYLGRLVEVAMDCAGLACRDRFLVRMTAGGSWQPRPGKPGRDQTIADIVVPIFPDETWRMVAPLGRPEYSEYNRRYLDVVAMCAQLARDEKSLIQDLRRAAKRTKLFAPKPV